MNELSITVAKVEDAEELLQIYAPYVEKTAITFEYEVPTVQEFQRRIETILKKYPYLVAKRGNEIVGYAYASAFHPRKAYEWSVETSIYVKENQRKNGVGKCLYEALEKVLKAQNILNLNACIAYPEVEDSYLTKNSVYFHQHLGYQMVGEFHSCGYKFGNWYNMVWMEKMIGEHHKNPKKVIWFSELLI